MRTIDAVVIHCADTPASMDIGAKQIRKWHVDENGWRDIGYHYVIRRDGTVELGRHLSEPGAHVAGHNQKTIGICLVGGKPDNNFTQSQFAALGALVVELRRQFPGAEIKGHREYPGTGKTCPQFDVGEWWADYERA